MQMNKPKELENQDFLDGSLNLHTQRPYGYSLKNQKAYKTVPNKKGSNTNPACAISMKGVVTYEVEKRAYNKIFNFIVYFLRPYFLVNPNDFLIDNNVWK